MHKYLLLLMLCICLPQLQTAEDLTDADFAERTEPRSWSRDELDALKDQIKNDYRAFYKARDFWSALQLQAWIKSIGADIKYTSPIGERVIGNPLYGFPHGIRHYYDFNNYSAVISSDRLHFIDREGKPTRPSVPLPFFPRQSAITTDGRYFVSIDGRVTGEEPNLSYYWRIGVTDLESGNHTLTTPWLSANQALDPRFEVEAAIATDASTVAACIRGIERHQDYVMLVTGGQRTFIPNFRHAIAVGQKGRWLLGRQANNNRWCLLRGNDKRTELHDAAACNGHAVIQSQDGNDIYYLDESGKSNKLPLQGHKQMQFWAFNKWLVVRIGETEVKVPDETDLFGTVIKKGGTQTVSRSVAYRWHDLASGKLEPALEIEGGICLNSQRYECLLSWSAKTVTLHDCSGDEIISKPFIRADKNIHDVEVRNNGIRVRDSDYHNHMYNYYGRRIWSGGSGYIKMIHPMVMAYERSEQTDKKNENSDGIKRHTHQLVLFYANGDTHTVTAPTPDNGLEYTVEVDHYLNYGRLWCNARNWLYFDLNEGNVLRDGHVGPKDERVHAWPFQRWGRHRTGRYNTFAGRLIPKWIYREQPAADTFIPNDAMYSRRGLMVLNENDELQSYDKDLELSNTYDYDDLHYNRFIIQNKDLNTYIARWHEGNYVSQRFIDRSGKIRELKEAVPVSNEDPEGEWQVHGRRIYLPRQGSTYWPEEKIGFNPWRMRSRSGVSNLLILTRSVLIELEASVIKKIFKR